MERERKGNEEDNDKDKGKHIEELKSKVKEARETVLSRRWAHGVVDNIKQCRSCGRHVLEGKGKGSEKGNAAVAVATFLGDVSEPVWGIAARARMVDIPLNERNGVRAEIGPPRTPEEWHRRTPGGRSSTGTDMDTSCSTHSD